MQSASIHPTTNKRRVGGQEGDRSVETARRKEKKKKHPGSDAAVPLVRH
jgi:hypothetical protein